MDAISFQLLFNGLVLGAGYGVLGLGFALTLRAAGAVNFAHGDVAAVAAYGGVTAVLFGATGVLAVGVAALVGGALGLVGGRYCMGTSPSAPSRIYFHSRHRLRNSGTK